MALMRWPGGSLEEVNASLTANVSSTIRSINAATAVALFSK